MLRVFSYLMLFSLLTYAGEEVRFLAYNLRNFLETHTYTEGQRTGTRYKPEEEIRALTQVIKEANPDILGVCEIGGEEDLEKFREILKEEGVKFSYVEHVKAADSVRHLALLSRYPIKAVRSECNLTYFIGQNQFPLRRGLLHVELEIAGKVVHALGVHFKSKRAVEEADEGEMRLKEAYLVREVLSKILQRNPEALLFLYGDFNDSYKSNTIRAVKGHWRSQTRLTPLELMDSRGEYWTHYWDWQREYGVFDYVFCSKALLAYVREEKCYIMDSVEVLQASDHRPLLVTFSF